MTAAPQERKKAYPDSGLRGIGDTSVSVVVKSATATSTSTSTAMSTRTSTNMT